MGGFAVFDGKGGIGKNSASAHRALIRAVVALICLMSQSMPAVAGETLVFDIKGGNSYIKQGRPEDDFRKKAGQPIKCGDSAVLSLLDNGRILLQTSSKREKINSVYGFAGAGLEHTGRNTWMMPVERMYLPPTGTTVDVDPALGGGCLFTGSDSIANVKHIQCSANIISNNLLRTVYHIEFSVVRNSGSPQPEKEKGSFDKISQYTLMNETLPDGKHPVWIYYEIKGKTIMRITMPSLDLCGVMKDSKSDVDILENNMASPIKKGSDDWNMALDIWKVAFDKYLLTGAPTPCK